MSVRRTVAQSSAGLLLLAAFAAGPSVAFGDAPATPGGPGPSDGGCSQDENGAYVPTLSVTPETVEQGRSVTLIVQCYPDRSTPEVEVIAPDGSTVKNLESVSIGPGGEYAWEYSVMPEAVPGEYLFKISSETLNDNKPFTVTEPTPKPEPTDPPTTPVPDPDAPEEPAEPAPDEDDGSTTPGEGGGGESGGERGDTSEPGDGDQQQDVGNRGSTDGNSGTGGDQEQGTGNGGPSENDGRPDVTEGSDEEQQGGDTTASGSPTKPFPGDEESGETSASSANDNAASGSNAPAQPPAAPGSATNDFPAAQQEATADQKQSAALAVLMTKLFAGGVSSGSLGTTPDQARTVIDPSADASEIEVPAGSDNGSSSDDGSGSESSDGDALAATGSNMLVPAGIAAAAILLGAGLKIHQIRRGL